MSDLAHLVATHRVLVCVGSGGVGKTTTAAALALWGVLRGQHTAVVSIDPAQRLEGSIRVSKVSLFEAPLPAATVPPDWAATIRRLLALLGAQHTALDAG